MSIPNPPLPALRDECCRAFFTASLQALETDKALACKLAETALKAYPGAASDTEPAPNVDATTRFLDEVARSYGSSSQLSTLNSPLAG